MDASKKEIWCTLGPSSLDRYTMIRFEELGVNLLRINLSHTHVKDLPGIIERVQSETSVPLCLDTEGAQIRTADFADRNVTFRENSTIRVHRRLDYADAHNIAFYPDGVIDLFLEDDFISIDFNSVLAHIIHKDSEFAILKILIGGIVSPNKAVTVLDRKINIPPLTEKDKKALELGNDLGIQYVALSFASRGTDVDEVRRYFDRDINVISKIESINGLHNLEEIASKSDGLLLDRGDLSREVNIERIPILQKRIIQYARDKKVKIYVATNLLESMVTKPSPTRAEVNDIFCTLYEGADGLVLASETAIGSFPVECVMLVSKMIKQLSSDSHDYSKWELGQGESLLLIEPHGGFLVNRVRCDFSIEEAKRFKPLMVDITALMDAEQIAIGAFSPLKGFMNYEEVASVLEHFRLPNGLVWPLPIVLQVHRDEANKFESGETIALMLRDDDIYALLHLQEIYSYDLDEMCFGIFGTNDCNHPGVKYLKKGGEYFLAGEIELIKRLPSAFKSYELMPWQTRTIFETKNWSKVVGFHTRNAIHRAHEHIQIRALEEYNCDGLFVHPVIGPKKSGDYSAEIIIKSYDWMVQHHYPKGKVVLGAFQNYSRYSGPREAVFTALCRKNFGCSHFIVGRDHTGLGNYYHADAAKILFEKLGDIGIVPIFFDEQCFCKLCNTYVEKCVHGISNYLKISGTKSREMLQNQIHPPDWFMREDVSNLIINDIKLGKEVFVK